MDWNFWNSVATLALAIPLAIAGNVLTRKYDRWAEKRGIQRSLRKTKRMREEYENARWLAARPQRFTEALVYQAIWVMVHLSTILLAATCGILGPAAYRLKHGLVNGQEIPFWLDVVRWMLILFVFLAITRMSFGLMRLIPTYYRVHYFEDYQRQVIQTLSDPDKELVADTPPRQSDGAATGKSS